MTQDKEMIMNIPMNVDVYCSDGLGGSSGQIIVNPTSNQVTHLVVRGKVAPHTEYMVPISQMMDSTPDMIKLSCTMAGLATMEHFIRIDTIENDAKSMGYSTERYGLTGNLSMGYNAFPYASGEHFTVRIKTEAIPSGEILLTRGAHVHAKDGRQIGRLDGFLADPFTGQITHLVLREGHLWGQKDVTIPVAQIDHMKEEGIYLKLDKATLSSLPTTPIYA